VGETTLTRVGDLAYREALTDDAARDEAPVLCLHGFPETSYMWRHVLSALADSGRRALALDLPAFGDSSPDPPGTWAQHVAALERFHSRLGLGPVWLVVHDWGGLIGLRWACDHPRSVAGLVISDTGFFADGRWHGMAKTLREEGQGEQVLAALDRQSFGQLLASLSPGFDESAADEYWRVFETDEGREAVLSFYRTCDFSELAPYEGKLGELGVPTLLLWGENDEFAPLGGAYRFRKQIPGAELVVVEGAGHFVYADEPERCAREILAFLERNAKGSEAVQRAR
jgi:pimeloyl-ACP methyl ester carboxylesterase